MEYFKSDNLTTKSGKSGCIYLNKENIKIIENLDSPVFSALNFYIDENNFIKIGSDGQITNYCGDFYVIANGVKETLINNGFDIKKSIIFSLNEITKIKVTDEILTFNYKPDEITTEWFQIFKSVMFDNGGFGLD